MTRYRKALVAGALCAAMLGGYAADAAGLFGGYPTAGNTQYPTTLPLTGNELFPVDTGLANGLQPQSELVTANQIAAFAASPGSGNLLIGGDASTNLFQRATSGSSVTTTLTYGGPDRWAYWSGTNTAMTVSQDTTAADLSAGFPVAFKMARTSGQTGVVPVCMAQEVETALVKAAGISGNATTLELTWSAFTGANYSPTAANMTAFIVAGTGTDEKLAGTSSMAFALNAGGGGSGTWTNQTTLTAAVTSLGAVSTGGRYAAIAAVPATIASSNVTELGVVLCFTPVGTAGTNDYVALAGIQLRVAPNQAALASATKGYNCATSGIQCSGFDRRPSMVETQLQQRYFYKITEGAALQTRAMCLNSDTTHANCLLQFPVSMRIAPTFTGDGGFTAGFAAFTTTGYTTLGNCSAVAVSTVLASTVASTQNVDLTCTVTTAPAAGTANFLMDNGGSGVIKATAEL